MDSASSALHQQEHHRRGRTRNHSTAVHQASSSGGNNQFASFFIDGQAASESEMEDNCGHGDEDEEEGEEEEEEEEGDDEDHEHGEEVNADQYDNTANVIDQNNGSLMFHANGLLPSESNCDPGNGFLFNHHESNMWMANNSNINSKPNTQISNAVKLNLNAKLQEKCLNQANKKNVERNTCKQSPNSNKQRTNTPQSSDKPKRIVKNDSTKFPYKNDIFTFNSNTFDPSSVLGFNSSFNTQELSSSSNHLLKPTEVKSSRSNKNSPRHSANSQATSNQSNRKNLVDFFRELILIFIVFQLSKLVPKCKRPQRQCRPSIEHPSACPSIALSRGPPPLNRKGAMFPPIHRTASPHWVNNNRSRRPSWIQSSTISINCQAQAMQTAVHWPRWTTQSNSSNSRSKRIRIHWTSMFHSQFQRGHLLWGAWIKMLNNNNSYSQRFAWTTSQHLSLRSPSVPMVNHSCWAWPTIFSNNSSSNSTKVHSNPFKHSYCPMGVPSWNQWIPSIPRFVSGFWKCSEKFDFFCFVQSVSVSMGPSFGCKTSQSSISTSSQSLNCHNNISPTPKKGSKKQQTAPPQPSNFLESVFTTDHKHNIIFPTDPGILLNNSKKQRRKEWWNLAQFLIFFRILLN